MTPLRQATVRVVNPRLIQSADNSNPSTGGLPPAESMIELSYGAQVTKWLLIRPGLQYILDPGAFRFARERRALPFGIRSRCSSESFRSRYAPTSDGSCPSNEGFHDE